MQRTQQPQRGKPTERTSSLSCSRCMQPSHPVLSYYFSMQSLLIAPTTVQYSKQYPSCMTPSPKQPNSPTGPKPVKIWVMFRSFVRGIGPAVRQTVRSPLWSGVGACAVASGAVAVAFCASADQSDASKIKNITVAQYASNFPIEVRGQMCDAGLRLFCDWTVVVSACFLLLFCCL